MDVTSVYLLLRLYESFRVIVLLVILALFLTSGLVYSFHLQCIGSFLGHSSVGTSRICPYCNFLKSGKISRNGVGFLVCLVILSSEHFSLDCYI